MSKFILKKSVAAIPALVAVSLVAFLGAGNSAKAQLLGYEGFNYTAGSALSGQTPATGGTAFVNSWNVKTAGTTSSAVSPGLGYTDGSGNVLNTSGNSGESIGSASTTNPELMLSSTLGVMSGATATADSGTIWVSMLWQGLNTSATGSLFRQASIGLYSGMTTSGGSGNEYLDIGMPNISSATVSTVNPNISLWYGGKGLAGQSSSSTAPAIDTGVAANGGNTHFVVLEFQMDNASTTADTLNMWIDPTLGGGGPTGTEYTYSLQDLTSINGFRFSAGNTNATYGSLPGEQAFDEIRVGDTFSDIAPVAAPEPATVALVGLSGLAMLTLRRKR